MGSTASIYATDMTASIYKVFVPQYEGVSQTEEAIIKISAVGSEEIHTLTLSKSESENSIQITCDDSIVNSLPDIFEKWVLVPCEDGEENTQEKQMENKEAQDDLEDDILETIHHNITPKVPEPVYFEENNEIKAVLVNIPNDSEKQREEASLDESDWVFVDINDDGEDVSTSREVLMLKEQISTLTIRLEQMHHSLLQSISHINFSNANFAPTASQFHLINQSNPNHNNNSNNSNNMNNINNNEMEREKINTTAGAPVEAPKNIPPPPPPPSPADLSQSNRPVRVKAEPPIRTFEQVKKALHDAIGLSDISDQNKEIALNNYLKSFASENARKYLDFMVTHYAQLITALPLQPKTAFELVKFWEANLFSKIDDHVERVAIRKRKMPEIRLKRDKDAILEEINKIFKFIAQQKREAEEKLKKDALKASFIGDLKDALMSRNKENVEKTKEELKQLEEFTVDDVTINGEGLCY